MEPNAQDIIQGVEELLRRMWRIECMRLSSESRGDVVGETREGMCARNLANAKDKEGRYRHMAALMSIWICDFQYPSGIILVVCDAAITLSSEHDLWVQP